MPLQTDPGVDAPIQEAAEANPYEKQEELEEEEEEDYLDPRYVQKNQAAAANSEGFQTRDRYLKVSGQTKTKLFSGFWGTRYRPKHLVLRLEHTRNLLFSHSCIR